MRALFLLAGAALALTACRNNDQTDNTSNVDENLTAENIVSNDVTAIDAVTGDAANMAADMDINFTNEQEANLVNGTAQAAPVQPRPSRPTPATPPPTSAQPAANAAANGTE